MLLNTVFEPINTSNYVLAITCSVIGLGSMALLVFYNLKPQKSQPAGTAAHERNRFKPLLSMGLFFTFLIAITTAFFSWWATQRILPVTIDEQYIETAFGKVSWDKIQRIYVHEDQQIAPFSGREVGKVTKILMIIEVDGKTHALSEDNYDLNAMGKAIKQFQKQ